MKLARRILLILSALVFAGIAIASLIDPRAMAAGLGYTLTNTDAFSEFRAIYVGLWSASAAICVIAARRIDQLILGDFAALLLLGQVLGRTLSLMLDGAPDKLWPAFVAELIAGALLLVLRPRD